MKAPQKPQLDKFKEAARELQTDDSEEAFDEKLRKIAKTTSLKERSSDPGKKTKSAGA